jgi:signal transduction histidine kinase
MILAKRPQPSLETLLKGLAVKWALIGLAVTILIAAPCALYSAKLSSERQLFALASGAARAFRPMILEENYRDAEMEMVSAYNLNPGERAVVRAPDLTPFYALTDADQNSRCRTPNQFCWAQGFKTVSLIYPIFYDSQNSQGLLGYLELSLTPVIDWSFLSIFGVLILLGFVVQAFGLSSALAQASRILVGHLARWAEELKFKSKNTPFSQTLPFSELKPMQDSVDGLHAEIEKLKIETAKEAKFDAQLEILQEIGHDLRTPHSQLAKYFALHIDTLNTKGVADPEEIERVQRTLKRMGELIRQFRTLDVVPQINAGSEVTSIDLSSEAKIFLEDFKHDPELTAKNANIILTADSAIPEAKLTKIVFYRIVENLVRNAIHSLKSENGEIQVSIKSINGRPTLLVKDNGSGISQAIQGKVFDFAFTTKPARGTGLGLGAVRRICQQFGANISFESEEGKGSTFKVSFQPAQVLVREVNQWTEVPHVQV